jgi:hypothetical protein
LFTFLNAFPVVVSSFEVSKDDHDDKAAQYIGAILKFDFIIALVVAEHLLSVTVVLTNYFQKPDIDLFSTDQLHQETLVCRQYPFEKNQRLN